MRDSNRTRQMARLRRGDLRAAYDVLCEQLENEANNPAILRAADWIMAQIETRNIRNAAREHKMPMCMAKLRALINEMESQ